MQGALIACASCHRKIAADSAFCSHCGQPVAKLPADRQTLLAQTADFVPLDDVRGAMDRINTYLTRWPDSPEVRDVDVARQCIGFLIQIETVPEIVRYDDQGDLASVVGQGVPLILANGLATAGRLVQPDKVQRFRAWMERALNRCAPLLDGLSKAADDEARSLLVDGRSRAEARGLTREDFANQAEAPYAAFEAGKLDAAYGGFIALKDLNPRDVYVRNMLGSILLNQGHHLAALQHFLYGFALDPTHLHLAQNTMRCLTGMRLYPSVIEIGRHYTQLRGEPNHAIDCWLALARTVCSAACAKAVGCEPGDFFEDAPDLLDEVAYPDHPWMPAHLVSVDAVLATARVFISYRRAGGGDYARRVHEWLSKRFPAMHVFRDETSMLAGQDFTIQLQEEIDKADVFLALIDADWTGSKATGQSRFLNARDVLRREIARALSSGTALIPVLLEGAMPPAEPQLPGELAPFRQLHAATLSEARFNEELERVLGQMARSVAEKTLRNRARIADKRRREIFEKHYPDEAEKISLAHVDTAVDALPRFYEEQSAGGKGIPLGKVKWWGAWECTATAPEWQIALRFTADRGQYSPFSGEFISTHAGRETREEIRGTWMAVLDNDKQLLLGLVLDGIKAGREFKVRIPFDRRVGHDLIGVDAQGVTFVSRNLGSPTSKPF
jgi:hypothetical protein